jgi:hypothetical protein
MGWKRVALNICAGVLAMVPAWGQRTQADTPEAALHAMTRQAGVIFAGEVTAVRLLGGSGGATGVVEIDFRVDGALRGASVGSYTLREWAGLWPANNAPFRVGQRYLMLLHAPGASGLSSPVGGMDGAIPIRGSDPVSGVIDLRWVGTRAVRPLSYALEPRGMRPIARPLVGTSVVVNAPATVTQAAFDPGLQTKTYASVMTMLQSWEREDHGTR